MRLGGRFAIDVVGKVKNNRGATFAHMPPPPNYQEHFPGARLTDTVECFWTSTVAPAGGATVSHRVLPDGCMDVLFDFSPSSRQQAVVVGTMTQAMLVRRSGTMDLLGVRFRPGGLAAFLSCEAAELTDGRTELTHFWGAVAAELWEQLAESAPAQRLRRLRKFLEARVTGRRDPFVRHCVERIQAAGGDLRLAHVETSTGLTLRQIERKFARQVGISPKTFARVMRFSAATTAAERSPVPDWGRIAAEFGFADQPHLTREFKSICGLTPTSYHDEMRAAATDVGFVQDALRAIG